MIEVISGPCRCLAPAHREALERLTTERFTRDLLGHDAYIARHQGIDPGTTAFEAAQTALVDAFRQDLCATDDRSNVVVIYVYDTARRPIALNAMRVVRGTRADRCLAESVGRPDSSLQTHALLEGYHYPCLPGFNPYRLNETHMLELRRWVSVDPHELHEIVEAGAITSVEADYVLHFGTAEVSLGVQRLTQPYRARRQDPTIAAYLWTCAPRSAIVCRRRMGLNFIPMYADGCVPTALARSPECFAAPLFERHWDELGRVGGASGGAELGNGTRGIDGIHGTNGANGAGGTNGSSRAGGSSRVNGPRGADQRPGDEVLASLRRLATATRPHEAPGSLSLPYLLLYDDDTLAKFDALEDALTGAEASYGVRVVHTRLGEGVPV